MTGAGERAIRDNDSQTNRNIFFFLEQSDPFFAFSYVTPLRPNISAVKRY